MGSEQPPSRPFSIALASILLGLIGFLGVVAGAYLTFLGLYLTTASPAASPWSQVLKTLGAAAAPLGFGLLILSILLLLAASWLWKLRKSGGYLALSLIAVDMLLSLILYSSLGGNTAPLLALDILLYLAATVLIAAGWSSLNHQRLEEEKPTEWELQKPVEAEPQPEAKPQPRGEEAGKTGMAVLAVSILILAVLLIPLVPVKVSYTVEEPYERALDYEEVSVNLRTGFDISRGIYTVFEVRVRNIDVKPGTFTLTASLYTDQGVMGPETVREYIAPGETATLRVEFDTKLGQQVDHVSYEIEAPTIIDTRLVTKYKTVYKSLLELLLQQQD